MSLRRLLLYDLVGMLSGACQRSGSSFIYLCLCDSHCLIFCFLISCCIHLRFLCGRKILIIPAVINFIRFYFDSVSAYRPACRTGSVRAGRDIRHDFHCFGIQNLKYGTRNGFVKLVYLLKSHGLFVCGNAYNGLFHYKSIVRLSNCRRWCRRRRRGRRDLSDEHRLVSTV